MDIKNNNLNNKKFLVLGAGLSGISAALTAHKLGAKVIINDINEKVLQDIPSDIETLFGSHPKKLLSSVDTIIVSPGIPPLDVINQARQSGVEVIGEVEFALRYIDASIGAITGTNGKSTTVSLLGEIIKQTGKPTFTGGNLGTPLTTIVGKDAGSNGALISLELSSFQLETIQSLHPKVAAILNLTEDHLDRYDSFEKYIEAKVNILSGLTSDSYALFNMDDPLVMKIADDFKGNIMTFSVNGLPKAQFRMEKDNLIFDGYDLILDSKKIQMPGLHNRANVLAAVGTALLMGVSPSLIPEIVYNFKGLAHRMEFSGEKNGIKFYNDSKATNVGSVSGSLSGFGGNYVLIMGGRHKGATYKPLGDILKHGCRAIVAIGESAPLIMEDLQDKISIHKSNSFEESVKLAFQLAQKGDSVVLSPACSSYDMFENYKIRGNEFKKLVSSF
jgi:UDP-N-acetylmuramoylalanine--D-glutamate ligase